MSIAHRDSFGLYTANGHLLNRWDGGDFVTANEGPDGTPAVRIGSNRPALLKNLPATQEVILAFYYKALTGSNSTGFIQWSNGDGPICVLQLRSDGTVVLRRKDSSSGNVNVYVGTDPIISFNVNHHWQVRLKVSAGAGELEIKINGTQRVNVGGMDNAGQGAAGYPTSHRIGENANNPQGYVSHPIFVLNDGVGLCTFPGVKQIYPLMPNGDVHADMTQTGGIGGQPYTAVDERPPDDADYNESGTVGHYNEYEYEDPPAALSGIIEVAKGMRVKASAAGAVNGQNFLRSNGSKVSGPTHAAPGSAEYLTDSFEQDPDTAAAWTAAAVTAVTGGEEVVA